MKKILIIFMSVILGVGLISTSSFASSGKGQKIYVKKLKKACGFNGGVMAKKHSQEEWKNIFSDLQKKGSDSLENEVVLDQDSNKTTVYGSKYFRLNIKIQEYCPKAKTLKDKYTKDIFDFLYNYANDSGNVPSC